MSRIIHIETTHIQDIRTLIEVTNCFDSEVDAEFIRDYVEHDKKLEAMRDGDSGSNGEKLELGEGSDSVDSSDSDDDERKANSNDGVNNGRIKILTTDSNQVLISFIVLYGSEFKKFKIHPDEYSVGLNLDELYKYIKNVDKDGTMSISLYDDDTQNIVFSVCNDNMRSKSICELKVLNLKRKKRNKKIEVDFKMAIRISSSDFHKACKDLSQFSSHVEITCTKNKFHITCKGELSGHARIFETGGDSGVSIKIMDDGKENSPNIVRLIFDLKYINMMYKCMNLSDYMQIYLKNGKAMFLKYTINTIGEMLVGIAPSNVDGIRGNNNYNLGDDAFYDDNEIDII